MGSNQAKESFQVKSQRDRELWSVNHLSRLPCPRTDSWAFSQSQPGSHHLWTILG